jgi:hypothetical protein
MWEGEMYFEWPKSILAFLTLLTTRKHFSNLSMKITPALGIFHLYRLLPSGLIFTLIPIFRFPLK